MTDEIETCQNCDNELDTQGLCPACDSESRSRPQPRPRVRDGSNGAPDMSGVVKLPTRPSPANRPAIILPADFVLAPDPKPTEDISAPPTPPDPDPITDHVIQEMERTAQDAVPIQIQISEDATMTQPQMHLQPDAQSVVRRRRGAAEGLRALAAKTNELRAERKDLTADLPVSITVLVEKLFPSCQEGDLNLQDVRSQAEEQNPKVKPFFDLYLALPDGDNQLREQYGSIVRLAFKINEAYEISDKGNKLTSEQSDLLRAEVDLEKMSAKALGDYQDRVAKAAAAVALEKQTAFQAARQQLRQSREQIAAMATHDKIEDALSALQNGDTVIIAVHLRTNLWVAGEPSSDGRFQTHQLSGPAVVALELSPPGEDSVGYTARVIAESDLVCFSKHTSPNTGDPGVFALTPEFPSLPDKRKDPFEAIRYTLRGWLAREQTLRNARELLESYRNGATPSVSATEFIQSGWAGSFYGSAELTTGSPPNQYKVGLEWVLQRDEEDGPVNLSAYYSTADHPQNKPRLDFVKDTPLLVATVVEPLVRQGEPVLNPDNTPRMRTRVLCEPFGFRRAILDTPNEQKARLAKLMETRLGIAEVQRENLSKILDAMQPGDIVRVAETAIGFNVTPEDKRESLQAMLNAMPICRLLGTALWTVLRDELNRPTDPKPADDADNGNGDGENGATPTTAEATQVAEAPSQNPPPATEEQANPVAAA